ncbi:ATP-binding cassette subfamily B protein [Streptomyces sp. KhCrAH-43]|uniref:ABC transporter ATP-binding protein n=1 Tax=unclassified Streptomyces TaxID=2593676 RepID=UPI00039A4C31|nr:ABC transporter ATP-binding protein [Streptomyces sp. KhCrAH-43]RAJ67446.1 ATP-binding cassette subfamily B protein [Streptomyces sp. KhCrAH-43]
MSGTGTGPRGGGRQALRSAGAAMALAWRAGPRTIAGFAATSIVAGLLPALVALLVRELFDAIARHATTAELTRIALLLIAASLGLAVVPAIGEYLRGQNSRAIRIRVQDELFDGVNRLPGLRHFENPVFQDELRLAQQAGSTAPDLLVGSAVNGLQALVTLAGFLATVFVLNPVLGVVTVVMALPLFHTQLAAGKRRARVLQDNMPRNRRQMFYGSLLSDTDAVKEIRLFGLQDFFRDRAGEELRTASAAESRTDLLNLFRRLPPLVLGVAVYGAGLLWAVRAVRAGTLTIGDVSMFLAATAGMQSGVAQLATTGSAAYQASITFGFFLGLKHVEPDLPRPAVDRALPPLARGIELRDVWFRYDDTSPWVLKGVDLTIPANAATALVGLNGAGKSTLVKLLCRLYDPTRGAILWDGVDIREIAPETLRERVGVVFQDYCRYDLTAGENIGLGQVARMNEEALVTGAAKAAGIHSRITALGAGYRTLLSRIFLPESEQGGLSGQSLSGGEWQRVAVARAFMRGDAELMILDEPSAGLDAAAEKRLHDSLRELRAGATSVMISHRLSAVRGADRIVVLTSGRVAEQGDHGELMALGGAYADLFTLQADGYQLDAPGGLPGAVPAGRG